MVNVAYSYVRMSTDAQLKGDSLRRQVEMSRTYARENGMTLLEDFRLHDLGVSAFKGDNVRSGALGRFLEAVRVGEVEKDSYLLVESLDRLSRQTPHHALRLFLDLLEAGVNIVTLSDRRLYQAGNVNVDSLLMSLIIMSRAHDESEMKSARLSAAWTQKRKSLDRLKLTGRCPAWLKLSPNRTEFELIEERVDTVRKIFNDALSGSGTFAITRYLNGAKVPTLGRVARWNGSYVTKILNSRAVLGEFQPHRMIDGKRVPVGDPIADYFPPIIESDVFDQVQSLRIMRAKGGGGRKGPRLSNMFSRVARCGYCGASMRYVDKGRGPKGGTYLVCATALGGGGCQRKGWNYRQFEESFLLYTQEVDFDAILLASERLLEGRSRQVKLAQLEQRRRVVVDRRDKTFQLIDSRSTDFLRERLREIEDELDRISENIKAVSESPDEVTLGFGENWGARLKNTRHFQWYASPDERQRVAQAIGQMVTSLTLFVRGAEPEDENAKPHFKVVFADGTSRLVSMPPPSAAVD